jgi:hypothetical protein
MIEFKDIEICDREWVDKHLRAADLRACEYSFANNFIWSKSVNLKIANVEDMYVLKSKMDKTGFLFPVGTGDLKSCVVKIKEYCEQNDERLYLYALTEENKVKLEEIFPGEFEFEEKRDNFDYIYNTSDLINLTGKKYHAKRNHIHRFKELDWTFEPITEDNIEECRLMNREWCAQNDCGEDESKKMESCAVKRALDHFSELKLVGGALRVNGKIIAFTIGEPLSSDTFVVHIEKAFSEIQGAYPTINREFAEYAASSFQYINREDDVGSEGLRKAKLSYNPAILLPKYTAVLKR